MAFTGKTVVVHAIDYDSAADDGTENIARCIRATKADIQIVTVFSNRQSFLFDRKLARRHGNGGCFGPISRLAQETGADFDGILLADADNDREPGTNFERNRNIISLLDECQVDDSKLRLTYMQVHHIAAKYPGAKITYNAYDDRKQDILSGLEEFFNKRPHMLPSNVILHLHYYIRGDLVPGVPVRKIEKNTGPIDYSYMETTREILEAVSGEIGDYCPNFISIINENKFCNYYLSVILRERVTERSHAQITALSKSENKFTAFSRILEEQLVALESRGGAGKAKEIRVLYKSLLATLAPDRESANYKLAASILEIALTGGSCPAGDSEIDKKLAALHEAIDNHRGLFGAGKTTTRRALMEAVTAFYTAPASAASLAAGGSAGAQSPAPPAGGAGAAASSPARGGAGGPSL